MDHVRLFLEGHVVTRPPACPALRVADRVAGAGVVEEQEDLVVGDVAGRRRLRLARRSLPRSAWLAVVVPSAGAEEVTGARGAVELPPPQPAASSPATTRCISGRSYLGLHASSFAEVHFRLRCTPPDETRDECAAARRGGWAASARRRHRRPPGLPTCASPPWARATVCTIARPRPLPPSRSLAEARLKRSKARPRNSSAKTASVVADVDLHRAVPGTGDEFDRALAVAERVVDHAADRLVDRRRSAPSTSEAGAETSICRPAPRPAGRTCARRPRGSPEIQAGQAAAAARPARSGRSSADPRRAGSGDRSPRPPKPALPAVPPGSAPSASASSSSVRRIASGVRSS